MFKVTAALSLLATGANCAMGWGSCNGNAVYGLGGKGFGDKGFEAERYAGKWYEIKRDKDVWYEQNSDCVTAYYTYHPEELVQKIYVNNGSWKTDTQKLSDGYLFGVGTDITTAKARFTDKGEGHVQFYWYPEGNYNVVDTDYDNWALIYGCDNWFGIFWTDNAWILSRTKTMEQSKIDEVEEKLNAYVFWYDWKT